MMKALLPRPALVLALLLLALLAGCVAPLPERPAQLRYPELAFHVPAVETLVLDNGIRLFLKEDHELPLVQVTAMVGAGAMNTPPEKAGFAGLFGRAWRTGGAGARGPEELDDYLDRLAAEVDTSLGPYTAEVGLSLRADDLAAGFAVLADLLRRPQFAAGKLELARLQAQEQVRRQNDNPDAISHRLLMAALYPGHFLGQTPTLESLAAVSRQDLVGFHDTYFAPDNLWLAVSGDFDRAALLKVLGETLGDWARREVPAQPLVMPERPAGGRVQVVDKDLQQATILIGDQGLTKDHPGQYAVRVMNFILGGGGFNSRMMREIRSNRGLAYSAYSYFQVGRRLPGPFLAGTETKNASAGPALVLTRELMRELRESPVSPEELQLARESLINSFVFGFENSHAVVSQQMSLAFYGYPADYLASYRRNIAAVTAADVQAAAREFIDPARQQVVLVGRAGEFRDELKGLGLPVVDVELDEPR